ncbi:MAG: hypothetical protein IPK66_17675 [Rhodospirillales bacterium]|nr:hypothetical protein [Rhodospirillales bacterium]
MVDMKSNSTSTKNKKSAAKNGRVSGDLSTTRELPSPSPWPGANARLLGLGVGLPISPLERLGGFSADDFERFVLEWAHDYLTKRVPEIVEVQQRGGAGDKGRDIIAWIDPSDVTPRRWHLYQCKHYASRLSADEAAREIGKILYYTYTGDFSSPEEYYFVTHKGITNPLQDLLDNPANLRQYIIDNWDNHCATTITSTKRIKLDAALQNHISSFNFSIFRAKQPIALLDEHRQTRYYLAVFGAPLINRDPAPKPPSEVAAVESGYVQQLFDVIAEYLQLSVTTISDFSHNDYTRKLFERSRIMFYSAEGLKELARDQMADAEYFDSLLDAFCDGLYFAYTDPTKRGLQRLQHTVLSAQSLQLGGHVLEPHATPCDREGVCHHLANEDRVRWCER